MKAVFFSILLLFIIASHSSAQRTPDTLRLSLQDVENKFLANNLQLLASKFGIEEARSLIRQSRLWDNPNIYLEQNIYNSGNGRYFDYTYSGENIAQIQQLFLLAGKRNKRVQLAQINTRLNEFQFFDLLRTLKFQLRSIFYNIYFSTQIINTYDRELGTIRRNVQIFDTLNAKGIISLKEDVRLKAFLFSLEGERLELLKDIISNQRDMAVLLNDTTISYIIPVVRPDLADSLDIEKYNFNDLKTAALTYRADLKTYNESFNYEKTNLQYQRALSVPDLKLGGTYDKQGNYIRNYTGLSLQMDLPVFNRNQGNIAASKYRVDQSKALLDLYTNQVSNEVADVYFRSVENQKLYKTFDTKFSSQFNKLTEGVLRNYQKRNITLLEFIDFYESYKASMTQLNRLRQSIINSLEEINFVTGTDFIKY